VDVVQRRDAHVRTLQPTEPWVRRRIPRRGAIGNAYPPRYRVRGPKSPRMNHRSSPSRARERQSHASPVSPKRAEGLGPAPRYGAFRSVGALISRQRQRIRLTATAGRRSRCRDGQVPHPGRDRAAL
jgi:hypothetical protein